MVEPSENVSPSTSTNSQNDLYQDLLSNSSKGSDFSKGSTIYQLEMNDAIESMMNLTNQVQRQNKENAEESGEETSPVASF